MKEKIEFNLEELISMNNIIDFQLQNIAVNSDVFTDKVYLFFALKDAKKKIEKGFDKLELNSSKKSTKLSLRFNEIKALHTVLLSSKYNNTNQESILKLDKKLLK